MAGSGYKTFVAGQALTAAQVQGYLQDQAVQVYASTAARSSALGTAVSEGMVSYRTDENALEWYTGSAWETVRQPQVAGKNAIINGAFDIWQRGTTFTNVSGYTADRWGWSWNGTGTKAITQQSFTAGSAPVAGYEGTYFLRVNQSVAGSGATIQVLDQPIENVRTFAGQTVTLSFWAKGDSARSDVSVQIFQAFGAGGSADAVALSQTISLTTSWTRYTYTASIPSISGKTIAGSSHALYLRFGLPINTTFTLDLWGVQLEAGSVATPFSRNASSIQGELAACQRYYYRIPTTSSVSRYGVGIASSTTAATFNINNPVTMRVVPTSVDSSGISVWDTVTATATTSLVLSSGSTTNTTVLDATVASGLTQYRPYFIRENSFSSYLGFSAEL